MHNKSQHKSQITTNCTISIQCRALLSWCYNVNVGIFLCSFGMQEKKEVIWLCPMTKTKNPKSNMTRQKGHQNYDCTTIADRLRTVSWWTIATQLVWLNKLRSSILPTYHNSRVIKMTHENNPPYRDWGPTANQSHESGESNVTLKVIYP